MTENGFEFSDLFSAPIEREFFPREGIKDGEGIKLMLNLDFLTMERMEQLEGEAQRIAVEFAEAYGEPELIDAPEGEAPAAGKKAKKPDAGKETTEALQKTSPKVQLFGIEKAMFKIMAITLAGPSGLTDPTQRLINSWNVVRDGKPVPVSYESFCQIPQHGLQKLYRFCLYSAPNPTKDEKKGSSDT